MTVAPARHLFEGVGIELEYMIVDEQTLGVRPIADRVLEALAGRRTMEVELGAVAWSNELALHVIELKTVKPTRSLGRSVPTLHRHVSRLREVLRPMGATLMPTAMHPWMDPHRELRLWPHDHDVIYSTFDRIFDCRGHGWANLQSVHVNLPFANDDEFGRLHAAIRLVLPLLPALAASSPVVDGSLTGLMDSRLDVYRHNADRIPSVVGHVIPEPVFTPGEYQRQILGRIYDDLRSHDPEGILRHEWVNARGCIARFDRMAIEIRVLDVQECPRADLAVAAATTTLIRDLVEERWCSYERQRAWPTDSLASMLEDAIRHGSEVIIDDREYLEALGCQVQSRSGREIWGHVVARAGQRIPRRLQEALHVMTRDGCLARRLTSALGQSPDRKRLTDVYRGLCETLTTDQMFVPDHGASPG